MKAAYIEKALTTKTLATIENANVIINKYMKAGYTLTLRQLYYQFVARDLIPNAQKEYKRLGEVVSDGRLCGLIDWNAIEDRTRNLVTQPAWSSPAQILRACVSQYAIDKWLRQPAYIEVWVEKEALAGVMERACKDLQISFFSCRGYVSQSEQWKAGMRLRRESKRHEHVVVLHFGDHDPSGLDMTRDIRERLNLFGANAMVIRVALNMDQVDQYQPPPNPAKFTDSRYENYVMEYGHDSWELDALPPDVLISLVRDNVLSLRNQQIWDEDLAEEQRQTGFLARAERQWLDEADNAD